MLEIGVFSKLFFQMNFSILSFVQIQTSSKRFRSHIALEIGFCAPYRRLLNTKLTFQSGLAFEKNLELTDLEMFFSVFPLDPAIWLKSNSTRQSVKM